MTSERTPPPTYGPPKTRFLIGIIFSGLALGLWLLISLFSFSLAAYNNDDTANVAARHAVYAWGALPPTLAWVAALIIGIRRKSPRFGWALGVGALVVLAITYAVVAHFDSALTA